MLFAMSSTQRMILFNWMNAVALWLAFGFTLGWYYTFTYSHSTALSGGAIPTIEACGGFIMYYFSAVNASPMAQLLRWMAVFPVAGILWAALLALTAPCFGGKTERFSEAVFRLALASLPLTPPGLYLAYLAGGARGSWSIRVMLDVAMHRVGVTSPPWVSPVYQVLGLIAFACHLYVYQGAFGARGGRALLHFLVTGLVYILVIVGLATLAAIPLRYYLT
mgnify:CR=1 FL=1